MQIVNQDQAPPALVWQRRQIRQRPGGQVLQRRHVPRRRPEDHAPFRAASHLYGSAVTIQLVITALAENIQKIRPLRRGDLTEKKGQPPRRRTQQHHALAVVQVHELSQRFQPPETAALCLLRNRGKVEIAHRHVADLYDLPSQRIDHGARRDAGKTVFQRLAA